MPKQKVMPGMEQKIDKVLAEALEAYDETASEFATTRHELVKRREAVLALMKDRKSTVVELAELGKRFTVITTPAKQSIKIKELREKEADEDESESETEQRAKAAG